MPCRNLNMNLEQIVCLVNKECELDFVLVKNEPKMKLDNSKKHFLQIDSLGYTGHQIQNPFNSYKIVLFVPLCWSDTNRQYEIQHPT